MVHNNGRKTGSDTLYFVGLQYLLLILLCLVGFVTAAVLGIITSIDWSNIVSSAASKMIINGAGFTSDVEILRNSLAVTSVRVFRVNIIVEDQGYLSLVIIIIPMHSAVTRTEIAIASFPGRPSSSSHLSLLPLYNNVRDMFFFLFCLPIKY